MQRVLVVGCSGSGKTTFSRSLAARLSLPFISLDQLYWQPGWREPDEEEFTARATQEAGKPAWVIDGNYMSHGAWDLRLSRADTIFWFDLPRWKCLAGVLGRTVTTYGTVRPEMAPGCPERLDWAFLRYVWTYRRVQRPKLVAKLMALRDTQQLHVFTTRAETVDYLAAAETA